MSITEDFAHGTVDIYDLDDDQLFAILTGLRGKQRKKLGATILNAEEQAKTREEISKDIGKTLDVIDRDFDDCLAEFKQKFGTTNAGYILQRRDFEAHLVLSAKLKTNQTTVSQAIESIESILKEHNIKKVIPDKFSSEADCNQQVTELLSGIEDESVKALLQEPIVSLQEAVQDLEKAKVNLSQSEVSQALKESDTLGMPEVSDSIKALNEKIDLYYEVRQIQHMAEITEEELPSKIVNKQWVSKQIQSLSKVTNKLILGIMVDKGGNPKATKSDFKSQFAADLALTSTLGIVLQAYSLAKLIGKENKTHEDKVELTLTSSSFLNGLITYPKAMVGMLQQCHAHVSRHALTGLAHFTAQAMPVFFGMSALLCVGTGYQISLYDKKLKAEQQGRDATLTNIMSSIDLPKEEPFYSPSELKEPKILKAKNLGDYIKIDNINKSEHQILVKAILHPENITDDEKQTSFYKAIEGPISKWAKQNPKKSSEAKLKLYHHQAKVASIKEKKSTMKRRLAVQSITTALTLIAFLVPPSAIGALPAAAIITAGNFFYSLYRDRKKAKAGVALKAEKEALEAKANPEGEEVEMQDLSQQGPREESRDGKELAADGEGDGGEPPEDEDPDDEGEGPRFAETSF